MELKLNNRCARCGADETLDGTNVYKVYATHVNTNKQFTLMYNKCAKCGETKVLQIDNNESLALLQEMTKTIMKKAVTNCKTTKKQRKAFDDTRTKLRLTRASLLCEYDMQVFVEKTTGESFTLDKSILPTQDILGGVNNDR